MAAIYQWTVPVHCFMIHQVVVFRWLHGPSIVAMCALITRPALKICKLPQRLVLSFLLEQLGRQVERRTSKIVINSFGSSEVNNVTFTSMSHASDRIGTIGQLLNAESRIVDPAGSTGRKGN